MNHRLKTKLKIRWPNPGCIVKNCIIIHTGDINNPAIDFSPIDTKPCTPKYYLRMRPSLTIHLSAYMHTTTEDFVPYLMEAINKFEGDKKREFKELN